MCFERTRSDSINSVSSQPLRLYEYETRTEILFQKEEKCLMDKIIELLNI